MSARARAARSDPRARAQVVRRGATGTVVARAAPLRGPPPPCGFLLGGAGGGGCKGEGGRRGAAAEACFCRGPALATVGRAKRDFFDRARSASVDRGVRRQGVIMDLRIGDPGRARRGTREDWLGYSLF
jgi:hypothetical protein